MTFQIKRAERKKLKLKIGLQGASGSGKTYSALKLAKGICDDWEKIFFIDTENESASYYSDLGPFNHLVFNPPYSPERCIEAIDACIAHGAEVIIFDSMTHEWDGEGGCLEIAEEITNKSQSKNSYVAWGKVTPRHKKFVDKVRLSPVHVITCTRTKQEYAMEKNDKGKTEIKKLGLKSVQREGLDYEYAIVFEIDMDHEAFVGKDRTGLFINKPREMISEETGKKLLKWANSGKEESYEATNEQKIKLAAMAKEVGITEKEDLMKLSEMCLGLPVTGLGEKVNAYKELNL